MAITPTHRSALHSLRLGSASFGLFPVAFVLLFVALVIVPHVIGNDFGYHVFVTICLYSALATAWNIVGGFAGQFSLGHAIFYGLGAYIGVALAGVGVSPWFSILVGAGISSAVGAAISYPTLRLRGPFFGLATLALLEIFRIATLQMPQLTGGANGLMVPLRLGWQWMIFREPSKSLLLAFGLLVLCLAAAAWVRAHRFGFFLVATREREAAALAVGINTVRVRIMAVMISAALTSMVGTYHGMYLTYIEPDSVFSLTFSIQITLFALIGGLGTVYGPLLGTLLLVPLTEMARGWLGAEAGGLHGLVYGTVLVLVVLFVPQGLSGFFATRWRRSSAARPDAATEDGYSYSGVLTSSPLVADLDTRPVEIGTPILIAERLRKNFGGLRVTNDVSLELRQGEILGVIGPNGAGKTTLFNLLSGVLKPDLGSVRIKRVDGTFEAPSSPNEFARLGLGRTFQVVQPFSGMTVLENIMVGAFNRFPDVEQARIAASEVAREMGLWHVRDTEARHLPIGGLKRLEVARVMAIKPRILLLDEVMAGLNRTDVERAIRLIRRIRDSGVSIVAIEHVMQAVMSLSDRVIVLSAGEIIASGDPHEVVRQRNVVEAYLGEEFVDAAAS